MTPAARLYLSTPRLRQGPKLPTTGAAASSRECPPTPELQKHPSSSRLGIRLQDETDQGPRAGPVLVARCVEFTKGLRKAGTLAATITDLPKCNPRSYLN